MQCPLALADERFLAAADRFLILRTIVLAGLVVGGADRGTRALRMYPVRDDDGRLVGVLSFHYSSPGPGHGNPEIVAFGAGAALAHA